MGELLVADPVDTLTRISDVLAMGAASVWGDGWRAADARVATALDAHLRAGGGHDAARVVREVVLRAPVGAHVVVASSMAIRHLHGHAPARPDITWHANRGAAGIDGNVSTALGVALATAGTDGAPVLAIVGDLALLHDSNAWLLEPATEDSSLTVIVLDDDGGTIFDLLPPGGFPAQRRLFATPHGRDLVHLAALHGLEHRKVGADGVGTTVGDVRAQGGRHRLVDVVLDPLDATVAATVRAAVDAALDGVAR